MKKNKPNKDWMNTTNVYEVNLRQYTREGTFNAFARELPRLRDMGVETLWFMPVTPISQKNKKGSMGSYYAASDYTSINPEFGTMDDFKSLVNKAQGMNFKVIIDWVANHTGWDHVWTIEHPDYYEKDEHTGDFKPASGMHDIIELDFKNKAMRKAMIEAMKFWITETGIDGFRCDLAFWVELDFWQEAKKELDKIKPLFWLAELDPLENPDYMQVFDAAYTWTWMHKVEEYYKQHLPIHILDSVLHRYEHSPGIKAWFTANHDENTWNGTEYEKYGDAVKALAVFGCTWPGMPLLYSGQELPNYKRLQFFEKDVIEWSGNNQLHQFYKILLTLRVTNAALSAAAQHMRLHTSVNNHALAYIRIQGKKQVLVLLNLSGYDMQVSLTDHRVSGLFTDVFSGEERSLEKNKVFEMKAWGFFVLQQ